MSDFPKLLKNYLNNVIMRLTNNEGGYYGFKEIIWL